MLKFNHKNLVLSSLVVLLASCGGGGADGNGSTPSESSNSERVQIEAISQSNKIENEPIATLPAVATAVTAFFADDGIRWSVAPGSEISLPAEDLVNADCADASFSSIDNGFRKQQTVTCVLGFKVPSLNGGTAKRLIFNFSARDENGNASTRQAVVNVIPRANPGNIVTVTPVTSTVASMPAQSVTLQAASRSSLAPIESMSFVQTSGAPVMLSNSDCESRSQSGGLLTCAAGFTTPNTQQAQTYTFQASAIDEQGNAGFTNFTVNVSPAGSSILSGSTSNPSTSLLQPQRIQPGSPNANFTCSGAGGSGNYTFTWNIRNLNSDGSVAAGAPLVSFTSTGPTATVTPLAQGSDTVYALQCTVMDTGNGASFPATAPVFSAGNPTHPTAVFLQFPRDLGVALSLETPVSSSALVNANVPIEALAGNSDGSTAGANDFRYLWTVLVGNGQIASANSRETTVSSAVPGDVRVEVCAQRTQAAIQTCNAEDPKRQATVFFFDPVTVSAGNDQTIAGMANMQTYSFNLAALATEGGMAPTTLSYRWFIEEGQGAVNNVSNPTTQASISSGPGTSAVFSVIAFYPKQLNGDFAALNLGNEADRGRFASRFPNQITRVRVSVSNP